MVNIIFKHKNKVDMDSCKFTFIEGVPQVSYSIKKKKQKQNKAEKNEKTRTKLGCWTWTHIHTHTHTHPHTPHTNLTKRKMNVKMFEAY